jgi:NhaA family Na+:H+ antiporter
VKKGQFTFPFQNKNLFSLSVLRIVIELLGVGFVCGIGFTMSLFIAGLAFEHGSGEYFAGERLGILVGSILSAILAYIVLQVSLPKYEQQPTNIDS